MLSKNARGNCPCGQFRLAPKVVRSIAPGGLWTPSLKIAQRGSGTWILALEFHTHTLRGLWTPPSLNRVVIPNHPLPMPASSVKINFQKAVKQYRKGCMFSIWDTIGCLPYFVHPFFLFRGFHKGPWKGPLKGPKKGANRALKGALKRDVKEIKKRC